MRAYAANLVPRSVSLTAARHHLVMSAPFPHLVPMKSLLRVLFVAGALAALLSNVRAQVIELRATINAAQETPVSTSAGTGTAVMFYDVSANTFDLYVTVNGFANTVTASHIHDGAPGVPGPVVTNLGAEAVYTRNGTTVSAAFRGIVHNGTKLTLLQNGAYVNLHSAAFPGGEVRGQLIAQPKRLVSVFSVAQEQAAFPATNLSGLNDFGAAVMSYNPGTNRISLRLSVYNFRNTLNNSHYHEGAPGVSGPVVTNLGNNANAGGYTSANGFIDGSFDIPYTGDPVKLLTGGAYLNFHSTTFGSGECRGQVRATEEVPNSRVVNLSTRGFVGTGNQVLITGLSINGPDPVRMLVTAKGPSLAAFGVTGALPNPSLSIFDSAGRQIAVNDDIGTLAAGSELGSLPGVPTNPAESALLVVLPPGNYTVMVSGNGGTGVALLEATDLRVIGGSTTASASGQEIAADIRGRAKVIRTAADQAALELCSGVPLASVAVASRRGTR